MFTFFQKYDMVLLYFERRNIMKNIIILKKDENGNIFCRQITLKGKELTEKRAFVKDNYWETGGTILLDEINEILDKEI